MSSQPDFTELPGAPGTWRLSWATSLVAVPVKSAPYRVVAAFDRLVPKIADSLGNDTSRAKLSREHFYDLRRIVELDVGYFPLLEMGTFWRAGEHQPITPWERISVLVDVQKEAPFARACDSIAAGFYAQAPPDAAANVISYPTIDPIAGQPDRLLIPCAEIFRFYYGGGSSELSRALFSGSLLFNPKRLVETCECTDDGWMIRLAHLIDASEASVVARMFLDKYAERQAKEFICRALMPGRWELRIRPPFSGTTRLEVFGKRVRLVAGGWAFFVLSIRSCDRTWPRVWLITPGNPDEATGKPRDVKSATTPPPRSRSSSSAMGRVIGPAPETSRDISPRSFTSLMPSGRFPNAQVSRVTSPSEGRSNADRHRSRPESVDEQSIIRAIAEQSATGGTVGSAQLKSSKKASSPTDWTPLAFFDEVIDWLRRYEAYARPPLELLDVREMGFPNTTSRWLFLREANGTRRERRVKMVRIRLCDRDFYLYDIEVPGTDRHPTHVFWRGGTRASTTKDFDEPFAESELRRCADLEGVFRRSRVADSPQEDTTRRERLLHLESDVFDAPQLHARRIIDFAIRHAEPRNELAH